MAATIYKNINFQGIFAQLRPGLYSGRELIGCPHQSTNCEDLDNAVNSIRVDANIIVAFADSHAISASGGGARVLLGPAEISDLSTIGMGNKISSVFVAQYRVNEYASPAPDGGVILFDNYSLTGRRSELRRGDYTSNRLSSEEVKFPGSRIVSLSVASNFIVILYKGSNFESSMDAVMVVGPSSVEDIDRLGLCCGAVQSIRVIYNEPFLQKQPTTNYISQSNHIASQIYNNIHLRKYEAQMQQNAQMQQLNARTQQNTQTQLNIQMQQLNAKLLSDVQQNNKLIGEVQLQKKNGNNISIWLIIIIIIIFILFITIAIYLRDHLNKRSYH